MTAERINRLLECLPGSGLPMDIQQWLGALFSSDHVGIDLGERDDLIRTVISLCPGSSETARCSYFLECFNGERDHPSAAAQNMLIRLRLADVYLPRSVKQLKRILDHRRQDGWQETDLCPSHVSHDDGGNSEDKTDGRRRDYNPQPAAKARTATG